MQENKQQTTTQQETAKENQPKAPGLKISASVFYSACVYVGRQPLRLVATLRTAMLQVQQEQKLTAAPNENAQVEVGFELANALMSYLMDQPCDDVYDLVHQLDQQLKHASQELLKENAHHPV